jgi:PAS domain S-box-containing protein
LTKVSRPTTNIERERLNSLINSMADGVIAIDERSSVVTYNGAALNILDINTTMTGQSISRVINLVDTNNQPVDVIELVRGTTTAITSRDYCLGFADGSRINLYLSIAPVHLGFGKGGQKGHVLLLRDITQEKALEEERNDFISVVSHELRTPIAIAEGSISNAIFLMGKSEDRSKAEEALTKAHEQVMFLSDMVNDLSTLSRAEGNKLKLEVEPINVSELIEDIVSSYQSQAEQKNLKLLSEIDPTLEILNSGKLYVREIIQNFLTNSIKYTEKGSVTLGARSKGKGVEFYVADTGIGIGQADREKIFDKFFRSNDQRAQSSTGKGLGLYITMKLARLLHAEINVESELNKGSRFTIFVPNLST